MKGKKKKEGDQSIAGSLALNQKTMERNHLSLPDYKQLFTKDSEELQQYFAFRKRSYVLRNKKGKGSYTRKKKHRGDIV